MFHTLSFHVTWLSVTVPETPRRSAKVDRSHLFSDHGETMCVSQEVDASWGQAGRAKEKQSNADYGPAHLRRESRPIKIDHLFSYLVSFGQFFFLFFCFFFSFLWRFCHLCSLLPNCFLCQSHTQQRIRIHPLHWGGGPLSKTTCFACLQRWRTWLVKEGAKEQKKERGEETRDIER